MAQSLALRIGPASALLLLAGCATKPNGQKENLGEALDRIDRNIDQSIDHLQDKTYN